MNGEATQASCRRLAEELGRRPVHDIIGFAERHAEALYRLDQVKVGTLPQAVWESVFFDVDKFTPYTSTEYDGEWLLYVPDQAYELATGKEWDHTTRYCFETFSNTDGWPHLRS